ncbi:FHA domain-containing protein [Actinophytocola sp.]|uniref:FHA domain-containing protein n=1 Tax=Actinophytocola sp. TaxID=1872138 RepID=UPI002D7E2290|nr:FHA domain-containing protein [Actinophytocola sp.]HET9143884.1 FHA domain-containing protein [Actinophytocola sp.]
MKLRDYTMSVHPGSGTVGRFPMAVLLLSGTGGPEQDRLINLFSGSAAARAKDLGARLETLFGQLSPDAVGAFAAVLETEGRLSVYLHGPVEVTADSPNVEFRVWGPADTPLLRYDAPEEVGSLAVYFAENRGANGNHATLDLRSGVVSGDGLVLRRAGSAEGGTVLARVTKAASRNGNGTATAVAELAPPVTEPAPAPVVPVPPLPVPPPAARIPASPPVPAPAAAPVADAGLHPTYLTRLLTRLLITLTVGVGVTFALGPVLQAGFAPVSVTYTTTFVSLALLLGLGLIIWDPVYGLLQRNRASRDWPAPLLLAQAVPEALLVYGVQSLLPGDLVVNQTTLIVHLTVTAGLIGAAGYGLTFVPAARKHLFRAGAGTVAAAANAPAGGAVSSGAVPGGALVWGINCSDGHFNRPDARYCGTCGTAMHGLTREPVQGPRPALGYLVADDGSAHVIDADYVIGRAPQSDGKVRDGRARGLAVAAGAGAVSDAHADVHIDQWDVTISDRGHAAGTYVREPDSTNLIRLAPGQPFALQSGTNVHIGQRSFVFHALNSR